MHASLTELYQAHVNGRLGGHDPMWREVERQLKSLARSTAARLLKAGSWQGRLYGESFQARVEDVYTVLLCKFIDRRFSHTADSIDSLLATTARNELMTALRKSRSPSTVSFHENTANRVTRGRVERMRESVECATAPTAINDADIFLRIRERMGIFRFGEYAYVRDALLSCFLGTRTYPGSHWLASLSVRSAERQAVYNAAIVSINRAIMDVVDEPEAA